MDTIIEMGPVAGVVALCATLGLARATYYRRASVGASDHQAAAASVTVEASGVAAAEGCAQAPCAGPSEATAPFLEAASALAPDGGALESLVVRATSTPLVTTEAKLEVISKPPKVVPRALSSSQRDDVLALLNGARFVDLSPAETYATLLDEGIYVASERTMDRILAANSEVKERRDQRRHPSYAAPELMATGPNQVWTWDITKLRGPNKGEYIHLYLMLDMYSRYLVGWMVSTSETAAQAEDFINETCARHKIPRGQLTIHADRGTSMKSK